MKFKVGDKVRVLDGSKNGNAWIQNGSVWTVRKIECDCDPGWEMLYLEGQDAGWFASRFELYEEPPALRYADGTEVMLGDVCEMVQRHPATEGGTWEVIGLNQGYGGKPLKGAICLKELTGLGTWSNPISHVLVRRKDRDITVLETEDYQKLKAELEELKTATIKAQIAGDAALREEKRAHEKTKNHLQAAKDTAHQAGARYRQEAENERSKRDAAERALVTAKCDLREIAESRDYYKQAYEDRSVELRGYTDIAKMTIQSLKDQLELARLERDELMDELEGMDGDSPMQEIIDIIVNPFFAYEPCVQTFRIDLTDPRPELAHKFRVGDRVFHANHKLNGTVKTVEDYNITVEYDEAPRNLPKTIDNQAPSLLTLIPGGRLEVGDRVQTHIAKDWFGTVEAVHDYGKEYSVRWDFTARLGRVVLGDLTRIPLTQ